MWVPAPVDNPSAVLATCFRVAKGGAAFCLTTNPIGHMAEFYDEYRSVLVSLGQHDRLPVLETYISHRGTSESLARMLIDAGFAVDDSTSLTVPTICLSAHKPEGGV
jgi:hypothetical protein